MYCTYTTVHASPPPACAGGMCAAFHLNAANTSLDLFWILDAVRCQEFTSFNAELRPFDMSFRQGVKQCKMLKLKLLSSPKLKPFRPLYLPPPPPPVEKC